MKLILLAAIVLGLVLPCFAAEPAWKAGVAKVRITPEKPVWLQGYASRSTPSTGTILDLYVRALALDDGSGNPAVLISSEILGFPADIAKHIADQAAKQYGLPRDRLLLNSTHTHCGPCIAHPHGLIYAPKVSPEQNRDIEDYARQLEAKTVEAIGASLKNMRPARLRFGHGQAGFAMNRRQKVEKGIRIGTNPQGPTDHDVPVLRVDAENGQPMAIVFGYACHNTTLGGDIYEFNGDYAGFAAEQLEKQFPTAAAMFVQGCGADANPNPRGKIENAREHGQTLAAAVSKTVSGSLQTVSGPLKSAYQVFPIAFASVPTRESLQAQAEGKDIYRAWQAKELLKELDRDGKLAAEYPYPLQVWRFGQDLTLIALAGEIVVDYDLRLKEKLGADKLWVAGYSNDVFAYVPSARMFQEGGYEVIDSMVYYVQPGPLAPSTEEIILRKAEEMVAQLAGK